MLDQFRKEVLKSIQDTNPDILNRGKKLRARESITGRQRTTKNKEELLMDNFKQSPPAPGVPGGLPVMGGIPQPEGNAPRPRSTADEGTGLTKDKVAKLKQMMYNSTNFRPIAIITDKDDALKMKVDESNPNIIETIQIFENSAEAQAKAKYDEKTGQTVLPKYTALSALRDTVKRLPETDPIDYALVDNDGNLMTDPVKPSVEAFVIAFPNTETGEETTSVIKKSNLYDEILNRGGFNAVGALEEHKVDKAKGEIPLVIQAERYFRKKDHGQKRSEIITVKMAQSVKQKWFPDKKGKVSMVDAFAQFPAHGYEHVRVIPRKIHKLVTVGNTAVAVPSINKADAKKKELVRYDTVENTRDYPILKLKGLDMEAVKLAFNKKANDANLETTEDLISSALNNLSSAGNERVVTELLDVLRDL